MNTSENIEGITMNEKKEPPKTNTEFQQRNREVTENLRGVMGEINQKLEWLMSWLYQNINDNSNDIQKEDPETSKNKLSP